MKKKAKDQKKALKDVIIEDAKYMAKNEWNKTLKMNINYLVMLAQIINKHNLMKFD